MGKILDLIPENLKEDLIKEVKQLIQDKEKLHFNNGNEVSEAMKSFLKRKQLAEQAHIDNLKFKK